MKESRLFKILYYLLDRGRMTAPQLANELEVSTRTIYRDIDALSSAGIPIYVETGRNGGISILENFVLDKAILSIQEKKEILSSLQSLSVIEHLNDDHDILTKLSALFHLSSDQWFEVDFSRWGAGIEEKHKFESLKDAIINHKTIQIIYVNSLGSKDQRYINPLKFIYKSKSWYIKAYCIEKQDFRLFKFNRILELNVTDQLFSPSSYPISPETFMDPPQNFYDKITLCFPKEMAYRVYDEFDFADITDSENTLVVTTKLILDSWVVGYILSFGANVEVLEPRALREFVETEAKKIYEKYKP